MKMRKLMSILLVLAMVFSSMGSQVLAAEDSTINADLIISTAEELIAFANDVNENSNEYSGKTVALANDIDLANEMWTPIGASGDSSPKFRGTFDGVGHTISNLYVKQGAAYHAAGFFGAVNGTVKNVTIDGAYIESLSSGSATDNGTAVLAGTTVYGADVENVHIKNSTVKGNRYVAGIVGYMDGTVKNCSVENVTIVATPDDLTGSYDNGDKVGGIVGYTNSGATEVSGCELKGKVSITGYRDMGGIVGTVQSAVVVSNNTNSAELTITVDYSLCGERDSYNVGEFIGRNTPSETSTGNTTAEGAIYKEVIGLKPEPTGSNSPAYTKEVDGYVRVWGEGGGNASESFVLKLYSEDTLMATTKLNNIGGIIDGDVYVTWNFFYPESNDEYWTTIWEEGHPNSANPPTKVILEIDGVDVCETVAKMSGADDVNPVVWEELGGVEKHWDGVTITNLDELKKFRNAVNAGDKYAGKTVTLTSDIDLDEDGDGIGEDWTPIGTNDNPFNGIFDGGNHTISNLVITGNKSTVGLFGRTNNGEIKNLILNNAKVSGRLNVGALAGVPYTSKYTNINLTGHVEVNGMSYVGGIGGKNAYANWTDITVNADETSYVNANSVENDTHYRTYVGGVIGFIGEGGHKFTNIKSNIDVKGSTCDIGGITGIGHYGNSFTNCSSSGDVEVYNAQEISEALEIGGIAGVWHNQAGYTVTFNNCTYTGKLKSNIEVAFANGGLIGAAYNSENSDDDTSGSLTIDNKIVWPIPQLPTATVTELENDDLTFALNFKADEVTYAQLEYYQDWFADFVLTVNTDITFNANGGADGYLSGQYDAWSENWVNVPFEDVTIKAGESIKVMEYAATLMGQSGLKLTYNDVYSFVKDFDCGVFLEPEFVAENPDLQITLELRMFNPEDESISYVIGETYKFKAPEVKPDGFLKSFYVIDMPTKTINGAQYYQFGIFAGIDSFNYQTAGFDISGEGFSTSITTNKGYTSITGNNKTVTAEQIGAWRIFGQIAWLPVGGEVDYSITPITYTPYVITNDGEKISGETITVEKIITE